MDESLLVNRLRFLALVQEVARRDVEACVDAVGIEALHYRTAAVASAHTRRAPGTTGATSATRVPPRTRASSTKVDFEIATRNPTSPHAPLRRPSVTVATAAVDATPTAASRGVATNASRRAVAHVGPSAVESPPLVRPSDGVVRGGALNDAATPRRRRNTMGNTPRARIHHTDALQGEEAARYAPGQGHAPPAAPQEWSPEESSVPPTATLVHPTAAVNTDDVEDMAERSPDRPVLHQSALDHALSLIDRMLAEEPAHPPAVPAAATTSTQHCPPSEPVDGGDLLTAEHARSTLDAFLNEADSIAARLDATVAAPTGTRSGSLGRPRIGHGALPHGLIEVIERGRRAVRESVLARDARWNRSAVPKHVFAQRLADALLNDLIGEVVDEAYGMLGEYVEGLAEHELAVPATPAVV